MTMSRIAVLFDAENVNAANIPGVIAELKKRGQITHRLAIGDFSSGNLVPWVEACRQHGVAPVFQPSLGKGKNAADIRLIIEAMELLRHNAVDVFAIVSSDVDFTPLALHLRHAGKSVLGFGRSPHGHAEAYTEFIALRPPASSTAKPAPSTATAKPTSPPSTKPPLVLSNKECEIVWSHLEQLAEVGTGLVHLGVAGSTLRKAHAALAAKLSGNGKLQKNLLALKMITIEGSGQQRKTRLLRRAEA